MIYSSLQVHPAPLIFKQRDLVNQTPFKSILYYHLHCPTHSPTTAPAPISAANKQPKQPNPAVPTQATAHIIPRAVIAQAAIPCEAKQSLRQDQKPCGVAVDLLNS